MSGIFAPSAIELAIAVAAGWANVGNAVAHVSLPLAYNELVVLRLSIPVIVANTSASAVEPRPASVSGSEGFELIMENVAADFFWKRFHLGMEEAVPDKTKIYEAEEYTGDNGNQPNESCRYEAYISTRKFRKKMVLAFNTCTDSAP
ncbi:hypothetical protein HU200_063979 [Digitaria exilis]|uniref:Uncharacterized protein n=1 Tax=Digitaria exilis TaxID=1010633 RepID=A0A835DWU1_9POAL|nr:hypothetical protein HU200_063979 [Digitaria exilis]